MRQPVFRGPLRTTQVPVLRVRELQRILMGHDLAPYPFSDGPLKLESPGLKLTTAH